MSNVKALVRIGILALGLILGINADADTQDMNDDLVRLVAGLDALVPIIADAERNQDKNAPVQFHFESWQDGKGIWHQGLKQDVLAMRQGIIAQINQPVFAPRAVTPLSEDYISDTESATVVPSATEGNK